MSAAPRFAQVAQQLVENGYQPVPLHFGQKRPCAGNEWQHYKFCDADLKRYAQAGTGILCGKVIAIDIDVRDGVLAAQIEAIAIEAFGPAPRRTGRAPKTLLLFQTVAPFTKLATRGYHFAADGPEDKTHRVEILAQGQQFVAYNMHPDTRQPYEWNGAGDPLTVPIGLLPVISESGARGFIAEAESILAQHGRPVGKLSAADEAREHEPNEKQRAADPALLREALATIPNDNLEFDEWIRITYAAKGALGETGLKDFLQWSAKSAKDRPDFSAHEFLAAKPAKIGAATIYYLAHQHGWNHTGSPPNDLTREPNPFTFQRLDEIELQRRAAIVQGLGIDEGAVVAIVGTPGAGKTAFGVNLALAIAGRATHWMGRKIVGGPVLYFGAEAPASVIMRAKAAQQRMALARKAAFYVSASAPQIGGERTSEIDVGRIIETINAVASLEGERVLVALLDTLASCLGDGDENGDGMIRLVAAAQEIALRTGACVILLHHPSKADAASLRGHGSLAAKCDSIIRIEGDELTGVRTATLVKARDYATGLQLRFELEVVILPERDQWDDPITTIVARVSDQPKARAYPGAPKQRELLIELERRYRTGERRWDEATIMRACKDLGIHRNSPGRILKALIAAGYVGGPPSAYYLKHPPAAEE